MNSAKFIHITRDERQVMHQRNCGDLQIHRADDASPFLKVMTYQTINFRTPNIKGKRDVRCQGDIDILFPGFGIVVFLRPMHEFCQHERARHDFCRRNLSKSVNQPKILSLENFDPNIGVKQVGHHQVFAGGSGSSGGSSNSLSAQHPMICAKSGRLRFNSSRVGSSFSCSTSEIASRTRDSNTRAFSGARRSKVRSSSIAIVVTGKRCHGMMKISTSHFPTP